ncbi:hypothetical protein PGH26_08475 [Sporosarcina jeotgali]|uniref:Tubby C-terminal domain-containing protein n=1 Tax=Sporosarcina jeotgali TaxID=3020056 RepID=A0ABZ0KU39_9BACL|nr:hypothetical protein [Sporosarcina sp. B2O-1]WOV82978.1 hypothetical protein PGH26_08475 [Sporosarcina sp. B2O-1]
MVNNFGYGPVDYFAVLPINKDSDKMIEIQDSASARIGYIQRNYKNLFDKVLNYVPFSVQGSLTIIGETDGFSLQIMQQSFKSTLFKLKWDVHLTGGGKEDVFLLEDRTKITTNPRVRYHKNANDYLFKRDSFNRTCNIYANDSTTICAFVYVEKLLPTHLKITLNTNDLTISEVLAVYYMMSLLY